MSVLTAEEINAKTEHKDGLANIRAINKLYRSQDESHLYPILNKFNATDRAIRKVALISRINGAVYGLEYCYAVETILSSIVNKLT